MRVIEKAASFEDRNKGVVKLPVGVSYVDEKNGLVFDYMVDTVEQDTIDSAGVLMVSEEKAIVKDLPADFEWKHNFAGWKEPESAKKAQDIVVTDDEDLKSK